MGNLLHTAEIKKCVFDWSWRPHVPRLMLLLLVFVPPLPLRQWQVALDFYVLQRRCYYTICHGVEWVFYCLSNQNMQQQINIFNFFFCPVDVLTWKGRNFNVNKIMYRKTKQLRRQFHSRAVNVFLRRLLLILRKENTLAYNLITKKWQFISRNIEFHQATVWIKKLRHNF